MIDRYFELAYYRDFIIPAILAIIAITVMVFCGICILAEKWRNKRYENRAKKKFMEAETLRSGGEGKEL